jgi:hypothetical protein
LIDPGNYVTASASPGIVVITATRPTTVAAAQHTQLSNQQNALSVEEDRLVDAVSLIGDLGSGWSASQLHDP